MPVQDIAERNSYQSQQALSKAFKKHFGVTPRAFRNLESYFTAQHKKPQFNATALHPDIRVIDSIDLVYIRIIAQYGADEAYRVAWEKLWAFAKENEMLNYRNEFIGLSFDDPSITKADRCRFYACMSTDKKITPTDEFGTISVEGGQYAVFSLRGSYKGIDALYNAIYYTWLPNSNYRLRNSMPFEKYLNNPDKVSELDVVSEIYIPIN